MSEEENKPRRPRTTIGAPPEAQKTVVRMSGNGQRIAPIAVYASLDVVHETVLAALQAKFG